MESLAEQKLSQTMNKTYGFEYSNVVSSETEKVGGFVRSYTLQMVNDLQIFDSLFHDKSSENSFLETAPGLFGWMQRLTINSIIVNIAMLLDAPGNRDQQNASLPHLLSLVGVDIDDCKDEEKRIQLVVLHERMSRAIGERRKNALSGLQELARPLIEMRNKQLAHLDRAVLSGESTLDNVYLGLVRASCLAICGVMDGYHLLGLSSTTSHENLGWEPAPARELLKVLKLAKKS